MDKQQRAGLGSREMLRLLLLGTEGIGHDRDAWTPAEALREMLAGEIPLDADAPESLPALLGEPADEVWETVGHSAGDLLLAGDTPLAVLVAIKDHAKCLVTRSRRGARHSAAAAVYDAAIAAAFVFHRRTITSYPPDRLARKVAAIEAEPWIPPELKDLFAQARAMHNRVDRAADPEN